LIREGTGWPISFVQSDSPPPINEARQSKSKLLHLKCQFGYRKVRYRGIAKNGVQVFSLLALANLYLVRGRLASA